MDASAFFARLRSNRGAPRIVEVPPPPPSRAAPTRERFQAAFEAVGGVFLRADRSTVVSQLARVATEDGADSFVAEGTPLIAQLGIVDPLARAGVSEIRYPDDPAQARAVLDRAKLGIVEAELALAETGTIGLCASAQRGRLISCLPRLLVVLLPADRLLDRLEDVPSWLAARGPLPSALSLLTGPSRTGDIEAKLIIGAHGPAKMHVIWID